MIRAIFEQIRRYLIAGRDRFQQRIMGALILLMLLFALGWFFWGQYRAETEDAYVEGNIVHLHTEQSGSVVGIYADTLDSVREGAPLVQLNPYDARLQLESAKAHLAQTVRDIRGLYAKRAELTALIAQHQSELIRAESEYQRRLTLFESHAISQEDLQQARQQLESRRAVLIASQYQLDATAAQVDHTSLMEHPAMIEAMTRYRTQRLQLARTTLYAPIAGRITKRSVQLGQYITPGSNLLSLVDLDDLWVTANFKESQLQHLRIGQPVKMRTDLYGRRVIYHGRVLGIDVGTGSAFALLPAQNATGNWIKVVQRVPVRISLDPDEVKAHPLRIGLSMRVTVDTRQREGDLKPMIEKRSSHQWHREDLEAAILTEAERKIEAIIADHWIDPLLENIEEPDVENRYNIDSTIDSTPQREERAARSIDSNDQLSSGADQSP